MATVTTRYRCPVTPEECPTSARRGFCRIHEWEQLVPERVYVTAEAGDGAQTAGPRTEGPGPAGTSADAPGAADRTADARQQDPASAAGPGGRCQAPAGANRRPAGAKGEPAEPSGERTGRSRGVDARDRGAHRADPGAGFHAPHGRSTSADSSPAPHTPSSRPTPTAPPTRLQSTTAPGSRPDQGAPGPTPVTPGLALVMGGALIPVRDADQGPTALGRDAPDCAHVPDLAALDQVSRAHAELYWDAGRLYIADAGSSNGTFVDGERITRPVQLWPGSHRLRLAQPPEAVDVGLVELDEFGAPR